jgi:hypothetical protein
MRLVEMGVWGSVAAARSAIACASALGGGGAAPCWSWPPQPASAIEAAAIQYLARTLTPQDATYAPQRAPARFDPGNFRKCRLSLA